ncbi:MAG TPA: hypothetical protein ENG51_07590 [Deltaproteobacteria bacterium]|nr:hypothetical protein [Deltaproteobacteria bacterium]
MNQIEKHHVRNTTQGLKMVCRKLTKARDRHQGSAREINDAISDIEFFARRLEGSIKGRVQEKHIAIFSRYSDLELLTMLLIGEAEGEPWESKVGVGLTVRNRVLARKKYFGIGWRGVMLSTTSSGALQFSCFGNKNRIKSMIEHWKKQDTLWQEHQSIALNVYLGLFKDFVGSPLYYHAVGFKPHGWWLKLKRLGRFGNHIFYH